MKRLLYFLPVFLFVANAQARPCDYRALKYNTAATVDFCLYTYNSGATNDNEKLQLRTDATFASGDIKINKDEAGENNIGTLPTDRGFCYSMPFTSTELTAARVYVSIVDQTSPKVWIDHCLVITTYGNSSAQHDTPDVNLIKVLGTASAGDAGYVGLDWGHMTNKTATNALTNTSTASVSGAVGSVSGNVGGNVVGSVGSVTGNVGGNLVGNVNGNVTGNVGGSIGSLGSTAKSDVNAEVDTALADYDGPTYTEMTAAFTEIKGSGWSSGTDTLKLIRSNVTSSCTLADGAISASKIATDAGNKIADMILRRQSVNVEASSFGDALDFQSLLGAVAKQTNNMSVSGSNLNIYRADGTTLFKAQTLSSDSGAAPITGLGTN